MSELISIKKKTKDEGSMSSEIDDLLIKSKGTNLDTKIWLADLTHTNSRIVSDCVPYGVGCVAAFAEKHVELNNPIRLFKYPEKLAEALEKEIPHIIGFSNYIWNTELGLKFAREIKKKDPNVIIIFGGPHYPLVPKEQEEYLKKTPEIDFYIPKEGEIAFTNLITALMNLNLDKNTIKDNLKSVHSLDSNGGAYLTEILPRLGNLSDSPSPYLARKMDEFFDGVLVPVIQNNRGCPFKCTFCDEGHSYYDRVSKRKQVQIDQELEYIAKRMKDCHDKGGRNDLRVADTNFGMFREDLETCTTISHLQEKYNWPENILSDTGKNNKERVIKASEIVNGVIRLKGAVQSLDQTVMEKIKRDNISSDGLMQITLQTTEKGVPSISELILCLPGETKQSHFSSMYKIIDSGFTHVTTYQLNMCPGSDMFSPEEISLHGLKGRFRILADCIGTYKLFGNEFAMAEIEKICNETATMSIDDYLSSRKMHLIIDIFYNTFSVSRICPTSEPIFTVVSKFLKNEKIPISEWLKILHEEKMEGELEKAFLMFEETNKNELYEEEKDVRELIGDPDTVSKYLNGTLGYNTLHTFRIFILTNYIQEIKDFVWVSLRKLLKGKGKDSYENLEFLRQAIKYDTAKLENIFHDLGTDPTMETSYNMIEFLSSDNTLLADFKFDRPREIRFKLLDKQEDTIKKNIREIDKKNPIQIGNVIVATNNLSETKDGMILRHPVLK